MASPAFADPSCALKELANVPARFDGGVVIDVSINGVPAKFWLSTSSAFTKISRSFAKRLNLAIRTEGLGTSFSVNNEHGTYRPDQATVSEIKVGEMVAGYGHLIVTDEGGDGSTDEVAGSLGLDYLNNTDIELDPAEKRVHLFKQIECPGQSAYWAAEHFEVPITVPTRLPVVSVVVDGKELRALVATGRAHSSVEIGVAKARLGLPDSFERPPPSHIPDAKEHDPSYMFKELVFGPITVKNPKLEIRRYAALEVHGASHIKTSFATDTPGDIGMDVLGKFHSMISLGNGKIYFTLPNERTAPARPPS